MHNVVSFLTCSSLFSFQSLYEATCQLREKRLDIEEDLAEEKKTNDGLKKELESFAKKSKVIDAGLKTAQLDLEAFQVKCLKLY